METDPLPWEFTPNHLADHLRPGLSNSASNSNSPDHIVFHVRTSNAIMETDKLYHDATCHPPEHHSSSIIYQPIPSVNIGHAQHHHRSNAVAIPLEKLQTQPRPNTRRVKTEGKVEPPRACPNGCQCCPKRAFQDSTNQTRPERTRTLSEVIRKPAKPDPYSFYRRAVREFCAETCEDSMIFEPRLCSYILLQHSDVRLPRMIQHFSKLIDGRMILVSR